MRKVVDYIGKKIHRLTILEDRGVRKEKPYVLVHCDCDNKTVKEVAFATLFQKIPTKSCGCIKLKNILNSKFKHGLSYSKEHKCWAHMKARCYDKNDIRYPHYGGRGIQVCDPWKNSFEQFLLDMGSAPSLKHSVNRKNIDADYDPSNCNWATPKEQANNTSKSRWITFRGRTQTLAQWADELQIASGTIAARIDMSGWSVEKAFSTPVYRGKSKA